MFKKDLQIIRVDGRNCFVDISAKPFILGDGKVVLEFRNYDLKKPAGSRFTDKIDFYLDINEFAYFCENLKTGRFAKLINSEKPVYKKLGGCEKDGRIISRQIALVKGMKSPFVLQATQGQGKKDTAGRLFVPAYTYKTATDKINIPLDIEALMKIGLAGESAIRIFDIWCANGVLEEKVNALSYKGNGRKEDFPFEDIKVNANDYSDF